MRDAENGNCGYTFFEDEEQDQDEEGYPRRGRGQDGETCARAISRNKRCLDTEKSRIAARIIIFSDVFQTLATIDAMLAPFFQQYPHAKIVVIGPPSAIPRETGTFDVISLSW